MPLTAIAFWFTYVSGCLGALFDPVIGLALYVLVYHLNPERQWWGDSVCNAGLRTSLTVALATTLGMLLRWPRLAQGVRQFPLSYVLAIAFGLLAALSLLWGVSITERGLYQAEKFAKVLIILFILLRCVRRPRDYQLVFLSWLAGVLYVGYYAQHGQGQHVAGRLAYGLGGPDFAESSDLAVHLVASLPLVGAAFFMARTWLGKAAALLIGALLVNTLIMTRTRNALVGLGAMILTGIWSLPRGQRLKGFAGIAVGTAAALYLTDPGWWSRMTTIHEYRVDESAQQRLTLWRAAVEMVNDHPLGIGLGNFHERVMDYVPDLTIIRGAHSSVMACLAELGWVGLGLYLVISALVLWRLGCVRRAALELPERVDVGVGPVRTRFHLGWHALALRAGLVGYFGCGLFTTRLMSEDFWLLVGLSLCLDNISRQMRAEQEAAQPAERQPGAPPDLPALAPQPL
jgi:hypothetical protein